MESNIIGSIRKDVCVFTDTSRKGMDPKRWKWDE